MSDLEQACDVGEATIPVVGEAEMAEHLHRQGVRVLRHRGRFWQQAMPGFYRPVHPLARLTAEQATWPTRVSWGFQACLAERDEGRANAATPAYVLSDLGSLDEVSLPGSRRNKLRRARRLAHMVELTGPATLRDQGYDVFRSAHERTGYGHLPAREQYVAGLDRIGDPAYGLVLAGLVDGRLGGYLTGYAVAGTAYVRDVVIATEALDTHISTGLTYEFIYACRRSPEVTELVHGLHAREDEGLCRYKDWLGLPLKFVPSRVEMLPGASAALRRLRPHQYYRLTGQG